MRSLDFFNCPNPSSRAVALGSTQPLAEMSTRNLPGGKVRLTASPPSVSRLSKKMWVPRRLTTLWASTACYRDSFTFTILSISFPVHYLFTITVSFRHSVVFSCSRRRYTTGIWKEAAVIYLKIIFSKFAWKNGEDHEKPPDKPCPNRGYNSELPEYKVEIQGDFKLLSGLII
jgi:hypothetical protein